MAENRNGIIARWLQAIFSAAKCHRARVADSMPVHASNISLREICRWPASRRAAGVMCALGHAENRASTSKEAILAGIAYGIIMRAY